MEKNFTAGRWVSGDTTIENRNPSETADSVRPWIGTGGQAGRGGGAANLTRLQLEMGSKNALVGRIAIKTAHISAGTPD